MHECMLSRDHFVIVSFLGEVCISQIPGLSLGGCVCVCVCVSFSWLLACCAPWLASPPQVCLSPEVRPEDEPAGNMPSSPHTASDWGCLSLHCRILAPTWGIANKLPAPSGYANTSFIPGLENSHSWPHNVSVGSEEAFLQICQSYPSHVKPETSWHQALNISLLDFGPHTSSRNVEECCSSFCPFIFLKRQFYRDYMSHESDSRLGCVREINQWHHCFADWIHLLLCGGRHSWGIQGASPSAGFGDPLSCLHGVLQCQRTGHHSLPEGFECQDLQQVGQKQAPGELSELLLAWSQQWVSIPSGFHDKSVAMGFPWCSSSKESTCQWRGQGLNPRSEKIPHATKSNWAHEPQLLSLQV